MALFLAAAFAQELELSHGWPEGKSKDHRTRARSSLACGLLRPGAWGQQ